MIALILLLQTAASLYTVQNSILLGICLFASICGDCTSLQLHPSHSSDGGRYACLQVFVVTVQAFSSIRVTPQMAVDLAPQQHIEQCCTTLLAQLVATLPAHRDTSNSSGRASPLCCKLLVVL